MSVSVCLRGYLQNNARDVYQFCVYVAYGRGLVLLRHRCDMLFTSGFVDDIKFFSITGPYSGTNFATKDRFRLNSLLYRKVGQNLISYY